MVILSVDIAEAKEDVQAFAEEQGLTFTILLDESADAARTYEVRGIPASFFIDRVGVIRDKHTGPLDAAFVDEYIEPLLP